MIRNPVKLATRNPPPPEEGQTRIGADGIEYAVYIHHPANDDRGATAWERAAKTSCRDSALREAHKLFNSRKYSKVEIKRSIFDRAQNRRLGDTVLVFGDEKHRKSPRTLMHTAIYLAFALLGAALFLTLIAA
ncbi:MAG: hypothetical protein KJ017_07350 [Alphaproteobacteria bacterium]|nr:hypothetical protein [Alphaproteobacteria bacterium]